jgi:hypothetical protein
MTGTPLSEYGQTWRIEIGDGTTGTENFLPIAGEVTFDWTRTSKEIDLSSKDDGAYAATGYGSQKVTISPSGKLKLPDPGLQRLSAVSKLIPPVETVKIMKGAIVKYQGLMGVGNFSTAHPNDDVCTWKCDLTAVAAPTVDDIGASS